MSIRLPLFLQAVRITTGRHVLPICYGAIATGLLAGCGPKNEEPPARPQLNLGQSQPGKTGASTTAPPSSAVDGLKTALEAGMAAPKNPYPEGTRLLSLKLDGDTAVLDLSSEFKKLGNMGSQGESDAQMALLKCFAKAPEVKKMRVLVEGKVYEGEHSGEWDGIPVHEDKVAGGA